MQSKMAGKTDGAFRFTVTFCIPIFSFGSCFRISVRDAWEKLIHSNKTQYKELNDQTLLWLRARLKTTRDGNRCVVNNKSCRNIRLEIKAVHSISLSIYCCSNMHKHYTRADEGSMAIFTRVDKVFYCNKYRKYYQKKKEKKERRKGKEQKGKKK